MSVQDIQFKEGETEAQRLKKLRQLVEEVLRLSKRVGSSSGGGGSDVSAAELITNDDETALLPNSRQLVAGDNITFDESVAGELEINATGGGGGSVESVVGTATQIDVDSTDAANPVVSLASEVLAALADAEAAVAATVITEDNETATFPNSRQMLAGTNASFDDSVPGERTINVASGSGFVDTVVGTTNEIDVDSSDPANPVVSLAADVLASLADADSAVQPGDLAAVATSGAYSDLSGTPTIPGDTSAATVLTEDDETSTFPNSRQLLPGTNVTFDDSVPGERTVSATGGGGGVTPAALTRVDDTNVTLTLGGTPATSLLQATSITVGWNGTLGVTRGGTGLGSYTIGDLLYASGTSALGKLGIGSAGDLLKVSGGLPSWNPPNALTKTDDTNVTLTLGGSAATALVNSASLTLGWTGTLAETRGGTAQGAYTTGDLLYASAANTLSKRAIGSTNDVLTVVAGVPTWVAPVSVNPQTQWLEYDDFVTFNLSLYTNLVSVGGTVTFDGMTAGHPGVAVITTLTTTATSNGFLKCTSPASSQQQIVVGGGEIVFEALIEIPTLWAGANTGQIRVGFMDEITGAPTNGVHMQYESGNTAWVLNTRSGASASASGGTVSTGWHHIRIVINSGGTSATLYVDGVSTATVSSGFPTAGFSYGAQVQKTAGTTPAVLRVDMVQASQTFSTPRW